MKLFDVTESIREGWPVSADVRRQRLYLELNRRKDNYAANARLRFGQSLSSTIFNKDSRPKRQDLEDLMLSQGVLAHDDKGVCVVKQSRPDTKALVRVGIAMGVDGTIRYEFDQGVEVVEEGVLGQPPERFPVYVLLMPEDTYFEVHRDGELFGLPTLMRFVWDGVSLRMETS